MKGKIAFSILLLLTVLSFSSCEDDPYYDDPFYEATDAICYYKWVDEYRNVDGFDCEQELIFNPDFTGREVITRFDPYSPHYVSETHYFRWEWIDHHYPENIYIRYDDGLSLYFEQVRIKPHRLEGYWDGQFVTFEAL